MISNIMAIIDNIRFYIIVIFILYIYDNKRILGSNMAIKLVVKTLYNLIQRNIAFNKVKLIVLI